MLPSSRLRQHIIPLLAVSLLFISCLDVQTSIRLKRNGAVDVRLLYVLPEAGAAFGRGFGADEPWPLPLTELDFRQQALRTSGVEVTKYRILRKTDDNEKILVELRGESIDALREYLGITMELKEISQGGSLTVELPQIEGYMQRGQDIRDSIESIVGGASFRLAFRPPRRPKTVSSGDVDGRWAVLDVQLTDILNGSAPETWWVEW